MLEELDAMQKVNDSLSDASGGVALAWQNETKAKPTRHFEKIGGPYSDGGSYALYYCCHCEEEFPAGSGVVCLPDGKRVVQCPYCRCVDPSWKKKFQEFGLVKGLLFRKRRRKGDGPSSSS